MLHATGLVCDYGFIGDYDNVHCDLMGLIVRPQCWACLFSPLLPKNGMQILAARASIRLRICEAWILEVHYPAAQVWQPDVWAGLGFSRFPVQVRTARLNSAEVSPLRRSPVARQSDNLHEPCTFSAPTCAASANAPTWLVNHRWTGLSIKSLVYKFLRLPHIHHPLALLFT